MAEILLRKCGLISRMKMGATANWFFMRIRWPFFEEKESPGISR
jgi:hypothetical protein